MEQFSPVPADPADQPTIEEILTIVAEETAVERQRLQLGARIDELGIASIDLMQTIFALETHFDIEIPVISQRAGAEFATIGDLVAHALDTIKASKPALALPGG